MSVYSFSFRDGPPPDGVPVIDARDLPNPHGEFPQRTGKDKAVRLFLLRAAKRRIEAKLGVAEALYRSNGRVAFGCYGGRHRSVALAEMLAERVGVTPIHLALLAAAV